MLSLPWKKERPKSNVELLNEEVRRQLDILSKTDPSTEEYRKAYVIYERLHQELLEEAKLKEHRKSRWFNAFSTFGLAVVTITAEYWSPITSKWGSTIMRPFRNDNML